MTTHCAAMIGIITGDIDNTEPSECGKGRAVLALTGVDKVNNIAYMPAPGETAVIPG
jgi:hypothetical protein